MKEDQEELVILYVKSFESKMDPDPYTEHPKAGKIYRAIYDSNFKVYKICFYDTDEPNNTTDNPGGILVSNLVEDNFAWKYEFEKVDEEKLLELDLESEDWNRLADWQVNPKKGIEHLFTGGEDLEMIKNQVLKHIADIPPGEMDDMMASVNLSDPDKKPVFSKSVEPKGDLYDLDPVLGEIVDDLKNGFTFDLSDSLLRLRESTREGLIVDSAAPSDVVRASVHKSITLFDAYNSEAHLIDALRDIIYLIKHSRNINEL